jgi:membrane associated rhomboid family serine protease
MLLICPNCKTTLVRRASKFGPVWICPSCDGRAVALEMVRKIVPRPIVNGLWQSTRSGQGTGRKLCPTCKRWMIEVTVAAGEIMEHLDVCPGCHFIWFDAREFEGLPKIPPKTSDTQPLPKEAQEALAVLRLDRVMKEQESKSMSDSSPDHWLEVIPAIFGIPIEHNYTPLKHSPIVTWLLAAVIAAVSLFAFTDLESVVGRWGLIPAELDCYFGLTLLTSFFLHAGFFHLLVNLYFLVVFGDNTEDVLGKLRYVLLIVLAALAGDVAHILSSPGDMTPVIGASGGISGILAYYCLRFPGARVGFLWWFRWFRIPVGMMFAFWVLLQIFEALRQSAGLSHVAAFAHLAGACVGAIFWAMDQEPISKITKGNTDMT